jgi:uncharacterized MnhB-related membrane protein
MIHLLLVGAAIFCAFQVMRARRLLNSTLWLACSSALIATLIYLLGAPEVAVIELSVGAGLVTVLFVFAFSIVGEATLDELSIVPKPLVWGLILVVSFLLGWFTYPVMAVQDPASSVPFAKILWEQRGLDVLAQIVLIFSGVLGLLGLLSEEKSEQAAGVQIVAVRPLEVPGFETGRNGGQEGLLQPELPAEELHS